MKSIEIFTGAGGLALGTHVAGFEHRALIEWNKDACDTLRRNAAEDALPGIKEWDILHPGRSWADKLSETRSRTEVERQLKEHLKTHPKGVAAKVSLSEITDSDILEE